VYRLAVEFAAWVGEFIDEGPLKSRKISAVKHLGVILLASLAFNILQHGKRLLA
jgi:hypothetical protein